MTRFVCVLTFLTAFICADAFAYSYAYRPHEKKITVYGFLAKRKDKCANGEKYAYPKKAGVCAACPEGSTFVLYGAPPKTVCLKCPPNALLVKRSGFPTCVSNQAYDPQIHDQMTPEQRRDLLQKTAEDLTAEYTIADPQIAVVQKSKEPLINVCKTEYPKDKEAARAVATCAKLKESNDFLCPYVERAGANGWACRACPKNAPYKSKDGGCFTCPFGEEIVALPDGKTVCASEMPKQPKKAASPAKKPAAKKAVKKPRKKKK